MWGPRTRPLPSYSPTQSLNRSLAQVSRENASAFFIVFREPQGGRKSFHYEASSPREAAEIVAKLNHLMRLQGGSRTQRLAEADSPSPSPANQAGGIVGVRRYSANL